jgi:steroid delta-isomerase-like uncharacterized protein
MEAATASPAVASPPTGVSNKELILWAFEALNGKDLAAMRQLYTDATVERFPDRTCHGPDAIIEWFEEVAGAIDDWRIEVRSIAEDGDEVFVQWQMTGVHTGPLQGIEPTGKHLCIDGIDHFTVEDGKVIANFVVADQMQHARQLGLMPPDGSVADRALKAAFNLRTRAASKLKR